MDYDKENKNSNYNDSSTEFDENDDKTSNYIRQFSCTLLGEKNNQSDLKLKISKLEAYSRQLCMNLIDLQKNREDITNKTLALSAELELTENEAEAISSETNVDFLLEAKKSGCCSICKGEIENDVTNEWYEEEANDLREPLNICSLETIDASECCCCMCSQNRNSYQYLCEKCNHSASNFGSNSMSNIFSCYENEQHARKMSQGDSNFCCICSDSVESSIGRWNKICACEQQIADGAEERFRGGVDCIETPQQFISDNYSCLMEIKESTQFNETCESCEIHNFHDSPPASPFELSECKLIGDSDKNGTKIEGNSESLEKKIPEEETSKIEQMKKDVALPIEPKNVASLSSKDDIFDNDIEDDSRMRINGLNRSGYLQYLGTINNVASREEKKIEKDKNSKSDLVMGLLVLFLIILSRAFRSPDLSSLIIHLIDFSKYLHRIFDISKSQGIAKLFEIFNREFANFQNLVDFFTNYFTFLGAVFGSISFVKSVWSVAKNLYFFLRKGSYDCYPYFSLEKSCKLVQRSFKQIIICSKSQFHFFSYVSWLALGFLIGRVSKITDNWFLQSSRNPTDHYFLDAKWW